MSRSPLADLDLWQPNDNALALLSKPPIRRPSLPIAEIKPRPGSKPTRAASRQYVNGEPMSIRLTVKERERLKALRDVLGFQSATDVIKFAVERLEKEML